MKQAHRSYQNLEHSPTRENLDSTISLDFVDSMPDTPQAYCVRFTQILSAHSSKVIRSFAHFSAQPCDRAMSFGLFAPMARSMMARAGVREGIVLHPMFCDESEGVSAYRYEIGTEHGVSALLGLECAGLAGFVAQLDMGYIINESNLCEEEVASVQEFVRKGGALLLGRDVYLHPHSDSIAQILGRIAREWDIELYVQDLGESYINPKTSAQRTESTQQSTPLDPTLFEELPESNGAFGYVCLESETPEGMGHDNTTHELLAPETFKAILKVAREGAYSVRYHTGVCAMAQECVLKFCPNARGTIGILPSAQVVHYPFVRITALEQNPK